MTLRGYSRQKVVDEYMRDYNPYKKHEPLQFDLRGYAQYVKKRNLKPEAITLEIFALFSKQKE